MNFKPFCVKMHSMKPAPKNLAIIALSLLIITAAFTACPANTTQPATTFDTITLTIKEKAFIIEVADTDDKRQQGLMNRDKLAVDHGMIFIFDAAGYYSFWMKNTKIPLDLVYLDAAGKVVDIFLLKPNDETSVSPTQPVKFAIELNAGTAKTLGLARGDTITLPEKWVPKK